MPTGPKSPCDRCNRPVERCRLLDGLCLRCVGAGHRTNARTVVPKTHGRSATVRGERPRERRGVL